MIQVSPFEYENLVRELYYRDLRQLEGIDRDQDAIQTLLVYNYQSHPIRTLIAQSRAFLHLIFS